MGKWHPPTAKWKKQIPPTIANRNSSVKIQTPTEWCLMRMVTKKTYWGPCDFALLPSIAEVALSLPMSNVWPERGASCIKRIKTRLRSRLKIDMLQSLMSISINGPALNTTDHKNLICTAVRTWKSKKKRRKIPSQTHTGLTEDTPCLQTMRDFMLGFNRVQQESLDQEQVKHAAEKLGLDDSAEDTDSDDYWE